jgi:putative ABC transport system permease protein
MSFRQLARLAARGLALHKLRSTLSALGIVFGVAAVVAMLAVSHGARRAILAEVGRLGITRISVRAGDLSAEAVAEARALQSPGLGLRDAEAITAACPAVTEVAPLRERAAELQTLERRSQGLVLATTPSYARTDDLDLAQGRFLADADLADRKRVVVLGHELARSLFPYEAAVGSSLRIEGEWFLVVGSLRARERSRGSPLSGRDLNRVAFVPLSTDERADGRLDEIALQIRRVEQVEASARLIRLVVSRLHRGAHDFELQVPKELLAGYERARFQFSVVVGAVATISLLVGGIGITNIMLASVTERTQEIGIRRALGAARSDVLKQFLAEAVLLTSAGGAVGLLLGAGSALAVSRYAGWPTAVGPLSWVLALLLAAATGIGFGLYPAWRAAQASPVESLRHE